MNTTSIIVLHSHENEARKKIMTDFNKLVLVTQKTWLEMLIERFNTKEQAKFYIESIGGNFTTYLAAHERYYQSLKTLKRMIPPDMRFQIVEKSFLPNFLFGPKDLVVVLGRDGLVINTAKYLDGQPILAINPDPERIDGILIPFGLDDFPKQLKLVMNDQESISEITMAKAELTTRESILGVNDLFIGHRSHQSARYVIRHEGDEERQISSGIIVTTGVGSTGWYKSIVMGAAAITKAVLRIDVPPVTEFDYRHAWGADYLIFSVREPWKSKTSGINIVHGAIEKGEPLEIESEMPENGVIFSDGMESDYITFNSGTIARIDVAEKKARLIVNS